MAPGVGAGEQPVYINVEVDVEMESENVLGMEMVLQMKKLLICIYHSAIVGEETCTFVIGLTIFTQCGEYEVNTDVQSLEQVFKSEL